MDNWREATLRRNNPKAKIWRAQANRRFPFRLAPTRQPLTQEPTSSFSLAHRSGLGDENLGFLVLSAGRGLCPEGFFGSTRRGRWGGDKNWFERGGQVCV